MNAADMSKQRVRVDGKFFRLGRQKFHIKGVTYGPFAPDAEGCTFASREQTGRDFKQIRELGANLIRTYYVPPRWLLDLAAEHELKVFVDVPWPKHLCFLDDPQRREDAKRTVGDAVSKCGRHPAVFAFSVVNEIPADIVRWSGVEAVEKFIDELVEVAKQRDPDCLCTFACYPPTEFLRPRNPDFLCFNVYLHHGATFDAYLARLQSIAGSRPLVLGEFGMDSIRHTEKEKSDFLTEQIEIACRNGAAGSVVFSYTDDWFRGGMQIMDWAFGLTTRERQPKESFHAVQKAFACAPHFPLPATPKVSVVVASYNGGKTLPACLESLRHLNYPNYEVILVDDGSKDNTPEIAKRHPEVRTIQQENKGLSVARNVGIAAAQGEIVAFTDSDCRADEDWLYYLVGDMLRHGFSAMGGHNFLPPEDSPVAAVVMASPGGPAHVLLTDREAEHVPGCNMAFYKRVLDEIGGFDPIYRKAGDDVDVCWRLLESGYRIGFTHAGFVWHYRRSTVKAYLRQQAGYGEAEALLARKHPEYFSPLGGSIWRGRIYCEYQSGFALGRSVIYHGIFGSGFFQKLYQPQPSLGPALCTSLEYHVCLTLPLTVLAFLIPALWPAPAILFLVSVGASITAGLKAELPRRKQRWWSRSVIILLHFLQPIERGLARFRSRFRGSRRPVLHPIIDLQTSAAKTNQEVDLILWSRGDVERYQVLEALQRRLATDGWLVTEDAGWSSFDLEVSGGRLAKAQLLTVHEDLEMGRRNIRIRLQTMWRLGTGVLFWAFAVGLVLFISLIASSFPWSWMLLLILPVLMLFIEHDEQLLGAAMRAYLRELSRELNLIVVDPTPQNQDQSKRPDQAERPSVTAG
jgi:glycosyltransferase involved in cell wall biosynthesis